jgi:hypothetical protein
MELFQTAKGSNAAGEMAEVLHVLEEGRVHLGRTI